MKFLQNPASIGLVRVYSDYHARQYWDSPSCNGWSPLHCTSYLWHCAFVKDLLQLDPSSVSVLSASRQTPLHVAFFYNRQATVRLLIQRGADIYATDSSGGTLLHQTVSMSEKDRFLQVGELMEHLIPMYTSSSIFRRITSRFLSSKTAYVSVKNHVGDTPLHLMVQNCRTLLNVWLVGRLLKYGTDISAKNGSGNTPLHLAVESCNLSMAQLLIANGADVLATNHMGMAPFHRKILKELEPESRRSFAPLFNGSIVLSIISVGGVCGVGNIIDVAACVRARWNRYLLTKGLDIIVQLGVDFND